MKHFIKNISSALKNVRKRTAVIAVLMAALVLVPAATFALTGGNRPVKKYNGVGTAGFDQVTFNSFTNVPDVGDERNFFHGRVIGRSTGFDDPISVQGGDELLLRVYVHNNADPKHNSSGKGVAKNTRVRVVLPTGVQKTQIANAFVSADNASPAVIEDTMTMNGSTPFQLEYVKGSATVKTNFMDTKVSDAIVNGGVQIGDKALNGKMNGCFEYIALVTFKVKIKTGKIDVQKTVKVDGEKGWNEQVKAKLGDTLQYKIEVKNTGDVPIKDLTIGDNMPPFVSYVEDSAIIYNTNYPEGRKIGNNLTRGGTIVKDTYNPGGVAYVIFKAKLDKKIPEKYCGELTLKNIGIAGSSVTPNDEDEATVKVDSGNKCKEDKPAKFVCEGLSAKKIGENKYTFTVSETIENATVEHYVFTIDGDKEIESDSNTITHDFGNADEHRVSAKIVTDKGTTTETCEIIVSGEHPPVVPPEEEGETPPTTLPRTGATAVVFSLGSIVAAVRQLIVSRRGLIKAVLR